MLEQTVAAETEPVMDLEEAKQRFTKPNLQTVEIVQATGALPGQLQPSISI